MKHEIGKLKRFHFHNNSGSGDVGTASSFGSSIINNGLDNSHHVPLV